jgi:protein-L-isoaspartate(D-aspartate) O-methyltransferase
MRFDHAVDRCTQRRHAAFAVVAALVCATQGFEVHATDMKEEDDTGYSSARTEMVREQIQARDIKNPSVLEAMRSVPRHRFVPPSERPHAYRDTPLPLSRGQTISQPYIVALMTELVRPRPSDKVLEIGTGSGYQAAVLAELVDHVYTIEIEQELARTASSTLLELGYDNVTVRHGDGYAGWPEHAPFDIIIVTAAPEEIPQALIAQLKQGGRMVVPVGPIYSVQQLRLIEKNEDGDLESRTIAPVRFVPMRREATDE